MLMTRTLLVALVVAAAGCAPTPLPPSKGEAYDAVADEWKAAGAELTAAGTRVAQLEIKLASAPDADKPSIQTELEAAKSAAQKAETRTEAARLKLLEAEKDMEGGEVQ